MGPRVYGGLAHALRYPFTGYAPFREAAAACASVSFKGRRVPKLCEPQPAFEGILVVHLSG